MKHMLSLLFLLPVAAFAVERGQLEKMLVTAASAQGHAYIEARNAIVDLGANALPILTDAASDLNLIWQQRLVARVCYERMLRPNEIAGLLSANWKWYQLDKDLAAPANGFSEHVSKHVVSECKKTGLWYCYLELTWKQTHEDVPERIHQKFIQAWPQWCREALKDQPEENYVSAVILERLRNDLTLEDRQNVRFYKQMLKSKNAEAVPVLVERYDAFNKREVIGPEMYVGENVRIYVNQFKPILAFADSRHAELLEKFIAEHPALANLKPNFVEVRQRTAPTPKAEPPFRLGTNLVVVAP